MSKKIGIVMVNYNGENFQGDCLRTIFESSYKDFEVIIVDSGSKDNSITYVKENYPQVIIVENKENIGVAAGNNIGIKLSIERGNEYTLLLNNDTEIASDMLEILIKNATKDKVVVPKMYYYDKPNSIWCAGGRFAWIKCGTCHYGVNEEDRGQYDQNKIIEYAPTCCMLIHNSIFDKIGLFDEATFMYFDDTDFCVRMLEYGIKMEYIFNAKLWHKVSSSSGGDFSKVQVYYVNRNRLYFMKKNKDKINVFSYVYVISLLIIKLILCPFIRKNNRYIIVALKDYFAGRMYRKDF